MGISSSKQKTTTNQKETGTVRAYVPGWIEGPLQEYTNRVQSFGKRDPGVEGTSALQQQAFDQAGNLGGWMTGNQQATNMALAAGNAGPNFSSLAPLYAAATYSPTTAQTFSAGAPAYSTGTSLGSAASAGLGKYAANERATSEGYIADQAQASRANEFMSEYLNPYLEGVVDTTAVDMDANAGEVRAAQAAAAARNGAFGGSRYGIQEAATEGQLARARASILAGLRSDAYNFAGQMGNADADRFTNTDQFNTGQVNNSRAFTADARNTANMFNAGQTNQRNANIFNTSTLNNQFNAAQKNQFALAQGQMDLQNNQFNANNYNQFALDAARRADANSQFNAGAFNQAGQFNAGQTQQNNQFASNLMQANNQFNANQRDTALGRQLSAAGMVGDLANSAANNMRGDTSLAAMLGEQQRQIAQQQRDAELRHLMNTGQLLGMNQAGMFRGADTTGTVNGTSTTSSSPGLLGVLGAGLQGASLLGWAPFGTGAS